MEGSTDVVIVVVCILSFFLRGGKRGTTKRKDRVLAIRRRGGRYIIVSHGGSAVDVSSRGAHEVRTKKNETESDMLDGYYDESSGRFD